ncbi:E3 ubiquitin-protein ligase RNF13-like [Branchiostoma lanceolatum]|uniref:E3 ubiquitin-protein ligase RNF13-like n=1 Tax=Branchiostoma lanceolatum TaxID=7740 RepID=UPI00345461EC
MFPCRPVPSYITVLYIYAVINLFLLLHVCTVDADVIVTDSINNTVNFMDMPSNFGSQLPDMGIQGYLAAVNPPHACRPVGPPPPNITEYTPIALIRRGNCDFDIKVLNAEKSGYKAAIVYNDESDVILQMNGNKYYMEVTIPSVFVGLSDGMELQRYDWKSGSQVKLTPDFTIPLHFYLLPFAIIVGICFVLMLIFMVAKFVRDRRRQRRSRLSKEHLKKIPTKKFKKGDEYDVCAICLDDYEEGDKLRILPCSHAYHTKCIDPWLTGSKRTCPVCKRRVIPGDDETSDSETSQSDMDSDDEMPETTPLLGATGPVDRTNSAMGTTDTSRMHHSDEDSAETQETDDNDSSYDEEEEEEKDGPEGAWGYSGEVEVRDGAAQETKVEMGEEKEEEEGEKSGPEIV